MKMFAIALTTIRMAMMVTPMGRVRVPDMRLLVGSGRPGADSPRVGTLGLTWGDARRRLEPL
jgi:hypothetical protein